MIWLVILAALFIIIYRHVEVSASVPPSSYQDAQNYPTTGSSGIQNEQGGTVFSNPRGGHQWSNLQLRIIQLANESGYDAALALAYAETESHFNPLALNITDPSYGLFQIEPAWLDFFHISTDRPLFYLYDVDNNIRLHIMIIRYFQSKGFIFPDQADIYNVGETNWRDGLRNTDYQQKILAAYYSYLPLVSQGVGGPL